MDERVLGDVPSEGSESGRRFGIYREHDPDLKMRSVTRNVMLFVTLVAALIAFSIFYPVMQYASKTDKETSPTPNTGSSNSTFSNDVKHVNVPSNCSTQIFSFGHDCTEQNPSSTEGENNALATPNDPSDIVTPVIRRFDETSLTNTEDRSLEISTNLDEVRNFKFDRTGRSKWPSVSTPYPYYKPTSISTAAGYDEKGLSSQNTNIFAIPYDLNSFKHEENTTSRVNFTPPPYVFTPYPNFTSSYAQLSPYKVPRNNSNFIKVMKYLNKNTASERNSPEEPPQTTSQERKTVMKVSGTYLMPLDRRRPGEIILSSGSGNVEEARPFFNGHAYVSDPFNKYRPTNPSDINRLIPVKSSFDTGPRFRKPVSFVPTSSIAVDITHGDKDHKYQNAGSHTVAIFHPPGVASQKPPRLPTQSAEGQKDKPLSVVLDIYPVTVDSESADDSSRPESSRERGRPNLKWKPKSTERPKWRPQPHRRPTAPADPAAKNHMIVHLNLFPNNRKPYSYIRRNRLESTTELTDLQQAAVVMPGGQFHSRTGSETAELMEFGDKEPELTKQPLNSSSDEKSTPVSDQPEFSALEQSNRDEEDTTTIIDDNLPNVFNNVENITEYNNNDSISSTLNPAESEQNSEERVIQEEHVDGLLQNKSADVNLTAITI